MTTMNELDLDRRTFRCNVERVDDQNGRHYELEEMDATGDAFPFFFLLWLEMFQAFRVTAIHGSWRVSYTVRRRVSKGRRKANWYAEARIAGKLRQRYVGQPADISLLKLEQLSHHFASFLEVD